MTTEPQLKPEESTEETPSTQLPTMLKALPNAPTQEVIDGWKTEFGEVFVSGFSKTELFVWRPLRRAEWIRLQESGDGQIDQYKFEEMVCDTCILWRSITGGWDTGKAGTATSLQEQVLQRSNFLSPQAASMLVAKL